eukprot:766513-Hanusia_phi.AAC.2
MYMFVCILTRRWEQNANNLIPFSNEYCRRSYFTICLVSFISVSSRFAYPRLSPPCPRGSFPTPAPLSFFTPLASCRTEISRFIHQFLLSPLSSISFSSNITHLLPVLQVRPNIHGLSGASTLTPLLLLHCYLMSLPFTYSFTYSTICPHPSLTPFHLLLLLLADSTLIAPSPTPISVLFPFYSNSYSDSFILFRLRLLAYSSRYCSSSLIRPTSPCSLLLFFRFLFLPTVTRGLNVPHPSPSFTPPSYVPTRYARKNQPAPLLTPPCTHLEINIITLPTPHFVEQQSYFFFSFSLSG